PARSCDSLPSFAFFRRRYKREKAYTKVSTTPRIYAGDKNPALVLVTSLRAVTVPHLDVRSGSLADMCGAIGHVRFTPESGHGGAKGNVPYGQKQTVYASAKPRPTARLDGAGNALTT